MALVAVSENTIFSVSLTSVDSMTWFMLAVMRNLKRKTSIGISFAALLIACAFDMEKLVINFDSRASNNAKQIAAAIAAMIAERDFANSIDTIFGFPFSSSVERLGTVMAFFNPYSAAD
jgi:hypothetical protein